MISPRNPADDEALLPSGNATPRWSQMKIFTFLPRSAFDGFIHGAHGLAARPLYSGETPDEIVRLVPRGESAPVRLV